MKQVHTMIGNKALTSKINGNKINGERLDTSNPIHIATVKSMRKQEKVKAKLKAKFNKYPAFELEVRTVDSYIAACPHCQAESEPDKYRSNAMAQISTTQHGFKFCCLCEKPLK